MITMSQRLQRLRDRGRMMAEIVDYFYAARFAAHFLPARDTFESLQRIIDLRFRHVVKSRGARGHGRVADVKFANQRNLVNIVAQFET